MRYGLGTLLWALAAVGPTAVDRAAAESAAKTADSRGTLEFVLIPAGSYLKGSPQSEWGSREDEQQHVVTLTRPFYLATLEVTQEQWSALMGTNPSFLYDCPHCPVENISWFDAVAFCNALSVQMNLRPAYTIRGSTVVWDQESDGFRLPTEAEWEYSCRATTTSVFNTGACLDTDQANYHGYDPQQGCRKGIWRGQIVEVGSFAPNAWQLYDTNGNVSEWCWDWHSFIGAGAVTDPRGPPTGQERIYRGGSFQDLGRDCRSATREKADPGLRSKHVGMRLARSAVGEAAR